MTKHIIGMSKNIKLSNITRILGINVSTTQASPCKAGIGCILRVFIVYKNINTNWKVINDNSGNYASHLME